MDALPLDGLRILAPTQLGAGPFGLMFLADLGADVVKIEHPGTRGDEARSVPPFNAGSCVVLRGDYAIRITRVGG